MLQRSCSKSIAYYSINKDGVFSHDLLGVFFNETHKETIQKPEVVNYGQLWASPLSPAKVSQQVMHFKNNFYDTMTTYESIYWSSDDRYYKVIKKRFGMF